MGLVLLYKRGGSGGLGYLDEYAVAAANQQVFDLTRISYTPGTGNLSVYVNGQLAYRDLDYIETSPTQVQFVEPLPAGAEVLFRVS